jgi:hypothetical protein
MKKQLSTLLALVFIILIGCNSNKKSSDIANYSYEEEKVELNKKLSKKVGDWVKEDVICYGLLVTVDKNDVPNTGKPIKARVIKIKSNEIKMKALEDVILGITQGCSKNGISKGETWMEQDGELFQTKEEAIAYLKKNKLYMD